MTELVAMDTTGAEVIKVTTASTPNHGVSVYLGRCRSCTVPLLTVTPVSEDRRDAGRVLEVHEAER